MAVWVRLHLASESQVLRSLLTLFTLASARAKHESVEAWTLLHSCGTYLQEVGGVVTRRMLRS